VGNSDGKVQLVLVWPFQKLKPKLANPKRSKHEGIVAMQEVMR